MAYATLTPRPRAPLTHLDAEAALHLVQAFHRELDLQPFLELLFSQLQALVSASGLRFQYAPLGADLNLGERARHSAAYNLEHAEQKLGTLTVFFARRANEQEIETVEDLLGLVMSAIKNCITVLELQSGQRAPALTADEEEALPARGEHKADALILVALDDYRSIRANDGEAWASTLMSSVHSQILEGLRTTDGVYQISEGLVAVLLPNTPLETAVDVAKKIRVLIAGLHLKTNDISRQLTACMGITDAQHATSADDVMTNARTALKQAQANGSNQIEVFER